VPLPGQAEPGEIVFTFRHRTKDEHAAFIEECSQGRQRGVEGAGYVLAVATAWDLEEPFTRENIEIFLQHHHMAEQAIAAHLHDAAADGQLGKLRGRRARALPARAYREADRGHGGVRAS
jgi:hypothetical protein